MGFRQNADNYLFQKAYIDLFPILKVIDAEIPIVWGGGGTIGILPFGCDGILQIRGNTNQSLDDYYVSK